MVAGGTESGTIPRHPTTTTSASDGNCLGEGTAIRSAYDQPSYPGPYAGDPSGSVASVCHNGRIPPNSPASGLLPQDRQSQVEYEATEDQHTDDHRERAAADDLVGAEQAAYDEGDPDADGHPPVIADDQLVPEVEETEYGTSRQLRLRCRDGLIAAWCPADSREGDHQNPRDDDPGNE